MKKITGPGRHLHPGGNSRRRRSRPSSQDPAWARTELGARPPDPVRAEYVFDGQESRNRAGCPAYDVAATEVLRQVLQAALYVEFVEPRRGFAL